jgi:uncharacterized damage-inducible protein DinB
MFTAAQLAQQVSASVFGENWTAVHLKQSLETVTWQQANTSIAGCNSIGVLTFHIGYYIQAILKVMQGEPLEAHDKYSFDAPAINNEADWKLLTTALYSNTELLTQLVANVETEKLNDVFTDEKYGSYYRNLLGVTEHLYYHMGQINLLKKMLHST